MCKYFLTIFSLHFYYPARGIFLISVLAHQLYRLQTPTHEADSKIKGHLPGEGRWVGIRCCHMSAGYLGGTLLGLLSHFTLATPQHTKWIGLAFSELCPFGPQSVLDVLNGLESGSCTQLFQPSPRNSWWAPFKPSRIRYKPELNGNWISASQRNKS